MPPIGEKNSLEKRNMEAWPVGRSYGKLKLFFPSWLVKMKRQRASSGKDKRTGESCLAPLRMPTVYNWSWDELMDGYAMNAFQVISLGNELFIMRNIK